jgi:hypothetical protein
MRFLLLIPFLLFGSTDIDEHTKKWINPEKKYEISGQHILNTINTIDSLENKIDSLSKNNRSVDTFMLYDTLIWTQLDNSIDTLYDTIYTTQYDTVYVNIYTNKSVDDNGVFEFDYSFLIFFGIVISFMAIMFYVSAREYRKK